MDAAVRGNPAGMQPATTSRTRSLAVGLVMLPALAACGGGSDAHGQPGLGAAELTDPANARLVITTDNGLRVRPTDGDHVAVSRSVTPHWSHHDRTWVLDLSCHRRHGDDDGDRPCPRMPTVDVPAGTAVTVSARNAGIDVAGVTGALDLTTVNGDVVAARSGQADAPVRLTTRNGSVRASDLRASTLHAATVNGDVVLGCTTAPRRVTATTTNGSVDTVVPDDSPAYRVTATTDNGRTSTTVATEDAAADRTMTLTTVNGDVRAAHD